MNWMALLRDISVCLEVPFLAGAVSTRMRLTFHPLMDDPFVAVGAPQGPLSEVRV